MKPNFFEFDPFQDKPFQAKSSQFKPLQPKRRLRKPRRYASLIGLCLVFLLPIALAWLTLQQGWFTSGANNHGQWVVGQINADSQWRLIIPQAAHCAPCIDVEPLMAQLILSLGRDAKRVRLMLTPANVELEAGFVYIADPPGALVMRYPFLGQHLSPPSLLSEEPLAKALLTEASLAEEELATALLTKAPLAKDSLSSSQVMAKALLEDLRRLLTYSRAG